MTQFRMRLWSASLLALGLLAVPLAVFVTNVWPLNFYIGDEFPPGQAAYIMMRPAGHIAFVLVFFQIVIGSLGRRLPAFLGVSSLVPLHRMLGAAALGFVLLHPLLFVWSRSLRSGKFELLATMFPNFTENYWELMLFIGAVGFYFLLVGAAAALWGPRLAPRWWRRIHVVNYAGFLAAFYHSISIGSETRIAPLPAVYWSMAIIAVLLALWRWQRRGT